jgi:uncharacterized protein (TIGR03435 family)
MLSDSRAVLRIVLTVALAIGARSVPGQTGTAHEPSANNTTAVAQLPSFEVATIKPAMSGIAGFVTSPGGRMKCGVCTLDMLMMFAFDVQIYQIADEPDWGHHDRFAIEAVPPDGSETSKLNPAHPTPLLTDEQRAMIQSLLIDRFHLKFHRESRTGPVYVLARGSGPLKLNLPAHTDDRPWAGGLRGGGFDGNGIRGENVSMPELAKRLSGVLQRPVEDETGISGSFDFQYEYAKYDPNAPYPEYQDIVAAILTSVEGVGLKLNSAKGPVETIVIDHVERPTPN